MNVGGGASRAWAAEAIGRLDREAGDAGRTPLRTFPLPPEWGITLRFKDESAHPTGSLKHRAARAMFRYAIAAGRVTEGTTVVEATGGTAAVAQAYFARLLGLPYLAVMPGAPSPGRAAPVERLGGRCRFVSPPLAIYEEAARIAAENGGHYLDQFTWAERTVDWRGPGLAEELFDQLADLDAGEPAWLVVGAGTGATSAALGRYLRYHGHATRLAVVDPENSAYFAGWATGAADYATGAPSRIEGIGRPRMEPGFRPELVDVVIPVPDAASVAGARTVRGVTGQPVGGSTGTNLWGALELVARMRRDGETGSIVTLIGDASPRHLRTYHDDRWAGEKGLVDVAAFDAAIREFRAGGDWRSTNRP
ncbi:PLP-dependent cysteine synthase family protein [Planosporangium sp. 12N6]|uniref:PLP-dependent cysteine synthase family protein n=1 Tax=Planosporangium spinosum TaxID=3402278 RepID=UPI003CEBFC74